MSGKKISGHKVTIYDVAEASGVGISTVSRVINNVPTVAGPTRIRVLEAIQALQYKPHRGARALAQKQVPSIAIAIPTFTTPFHNELLKGVRTALVGKELDLLLLDLGSASPAGSLQRILQRGAVNGLLLAGVPIDNPIASELSALRSPVVLIGHHHAQFDSYYWDDAQGATFAVNHLVAMGHKRIGMIRSHTDSYLQLRRVEGYRDALRGAGIKMQSNLVQCGLNPKHGGFSEEHGFEAIKQLLSRKPVPTAVFASSDVQAIGAIAAIREAGLSVPDDIALIGYDDIKTSRFIGLSSVAQGMEAVGRMATTRLLGCLQRSTTGTRVIHKILPELRIRHSSDPSKSVYQSRTNL